MPPSRQVMLPKLFNAVRTLSFICTARCLELIPNHPNTIKQPLVSNN